MKKVLIKIFNILPKCALKNKIRCYGFNFFHKNGEFRASYKKNYFQFSFKNGIIIKSYYDMCGDLSVPLDGYLKNYTPQRRDFVVDGGAYGGAFSIYVSKIIGNTGLVIAFEPDIENYKLLLKNIKLNGVTNITPINKGLWSRDTVLPFYNKNVDSSSFFFDHDQQDYIINVSVASLDNQLREIGLRKVDFIKMDVEGAELEAIKGSEKTLKNNNVRLAIASYHILNGKKTCFKLEKLLLEFGYKTETSFPMHLTTYAEK